MQVLHALNTMNVWLQTFNAFYVVIHSKLLLWIKKTIQTIFIKNYKYKEMLKKKHIRSICVRNEEYKFEFFAK